MSFSNTQQSYGTSTYTSSGGVYANVATGRGVLFGVFSSLVSGAAVAPGTGRLTVYDAVSGNQAPYTSNVSKFYDFLNVAVVSGVVQPQAPNETSINAPFFSGLNVLISGATTALTLNYRLGI